jgi:hypothetical protein
MLSKDLPAILILPRLPSESTPLPLVIASIYAAKSEIRYFLRGPGLLLASGGGMETAL